MKTRLVPIIVIPIAVILIVFAVFPTFFLPPYNSYEPLSVDLQIGGLKELYQHDESFSFGVMVKSLGYNQPFPSYQIFKEGNAEPVWERNYMTPIEPNSIPENREKQFYFPLEEDDVITFNESGNYTLRVSIGKEFVEKKFQVSHIPYLKEDSTKLDMNNKISEVILSSISYDDKREALIQHIQEQNLKPFSEIIIQGLEPEYEYEEKPSFTVINFGYRNWCLMPAIAVYYENEPIPIYEGGAVHSCPPPHDPPNARISSYPDKHFPLFPSCRYDGMHIIVGQGFEFGPRQIGEYYCNGKDKFVPPTIHKIIIPDGATNSQIQPKFIPEKITAREGDIIKFVNNDKAEFWLVAKHDSDTERDITLHFDPQESREFKRINSGNYTVSIEIDHESMPWMHAMIFVQ